MFDPLVILISSDPSLPDDLSVPDLRKPINIGYEALSTFRSYAATRVGRGAEAAARLRGWIWSDEHATRYIHFRMCGDDGQADPPLGWALSTKAQEDILGYLPGAEPDEEDLCRHDNWARFGTTKQQISAPPKALGTQAGRLSADGVLQRFVHRLE